MPEEKGHAKNIANLAQAITSLNSLGTLTIRIAQTAACSEALYDDISNLLARVNLVKKYLKSIIDKGNPQYRQIVALKFKQPGH